MTNNPKSKKSKLPLIFSFGLIAIGVLCYFLISDFQDFCNEAFRILTSGDRERISRWVERFGVWGPVIIIFGQVLQMFLFVVPSVLLMIVAILAYGPWLGSLYALLGMILASSIAYFIGQGASETLLDKILGEKARKKFTGYVEKYGWWVVALARVNPILSNDTVSFVSGIANMKFWKFMLATILATIPLLALIAIIGQNQSDLKTGMYWISGAGVLFGLIYFLFKRHHDKKH